MEEGAPTEAELLRAHRGGDARAFGRLYDRYDRALFGFIRRLLGAAHASAAEDIHQEVWIAVSKNAAAFDPARATFAAWLFAIARNRVFDHFRRHRVAAPAAEFGEVVEWVADPGPTPFEEVQSREQAGAVIAAVEALPLEQRGVFVMVADGGLSLEEVAHATDTAVETVKSRLRYARAKLRQVLSGERSTHV